jgi:hypothetical protein
MNYYVIAHVIAHISADVISGKKTGFTLPETAHSKEWTKAGWQLSYDKLQ